MHHIALSFAMLLAILHSALASPTTGINDIIQPLHDPELSNLLSSIEILREKQTNSGLVVRVFRTWSGSECDPGREAKTCPHTKLYFVSGLNEEGLTSVQVWETSSLIGWEVRDMVEIDKDPAKEGLPPELAVSAVVCRAPADVEHGKVHAIKGTPLSPETWWRKFKYRFTVGIGQISVEQDGGPGDYCALY
jgi:hypothetical protein